MLNIESFLRKTAEYINATHPEFTVYVEKTPDVLLYQVLSISKKGGSKITLSYTDNYSPDDLNYLGNDVEHTPENYAKYVMSLLEK